MKRTQATVTVIPDVVAPFPETYPTHAAVTRIVTGLPDIVDDLERQATDLVVKNKATYEEGIELANRIGVKLTEEDVKRKEQAKPFYDVYTGINSAFKPWLEKLRAAQLSVKHKAEQWYLAERDKQRRAEEAQRNREADRIAAGKTVVPRRIAEPMAQTIHTDTGAKGTMREGWTFELVDLSKVPRKFLMLNVKLVQATIDSESKTLGEPTEIKGLLLKRTAGLATGRNRK